MTNEEELHFLKKNVFYGLTNLNNGFDYEGVLYFSEADFAIVLDRVEKLNIGIFGIEPWTEGDFYGVSIHEDFNAQPEDPNWYRKAFEDFRQQNKNLYYSATYKITEFSLD